MSNNLAKDHGGQRKWTFGFDNRMFVVDLDDDAIEELQKSPLVERIEIEPMARIFSKSRPTTPYAVNTDWGVDRIYPEFAWAQGNYGRSTSGRAIKVSVSIPASSRPMRPSGRMVFAFLRAATISCPAAITRLTTMTTALIAAPSWPAQHNGLVGLTGAWLLTSTFTPAKFWTPRGPALSPISLRRRLGPD